MERFDNRPLGACENGAVFLDRLERDYQFDCEAGPLVLCSDWVELRRCFAAMAEFIRHPETALTPAPQAEGQVRANDDACEALARAYDREDAAQRGETDPWSIGIDDDPEWVADRIACARAGLAALTASPGWQPIETISRAAQDVLAERQRQISVEGWDDTHDDCNDKSELAQAAACYALSGTPADEAVFIHGRWKDPRDLFWPWTWDRSWWKPTNRRRDLVKAGALILAEIERLDRAAPEAEGGCDER